MKPVIVLGNWKANKTLQEAQEWISMFSASAKTIAGITVILCPSYHHIPLFIDAKLPVSLGVQDISLYSTGAYTGEIAASQICEHISYALIGHSERRKYFGEDDMTVAGKVKQCLSMNIKPVVCMSQEQEARALVSKVSDFAKTGLILYEPLFAVGSGTPDTPENANATAKKIFEIVGNVPILYGGSVVPENTGSFCKEQYLAGVGVGGASLDAVKFGNIMEAATS